jgi:hypothetical protein
MALMRAVAQPTPLSTFMAEQAQFSEHAPHSMHLSLSVITALPSWISNTPRGQTSAHIPQPAQLSGNNSRVTTFDRYLI